VAKTSRRVEILCGRGGRGIPFRCNPTTEA
jgi:hypothetical protein